MSRPAPVVSVVMGVFNGEASLRATVQSILDQDGVDFEFVIVNDGSSDGTAKLLDELAAADARIHVIHQQNHGLTRALAHGCNLARGKVIARQDSGDLSLPGRLRAQLDVLDSAGDVCLVSCATRFVGPAGELLYETVLDSHAANEGLRTLNLKAIRGPAHHGSTMFRRDWYEQAGGYRKEFYFAQDMDLWTRLIEHGRHIAIPDILYQAAFALGSISSLNRDRQIASARIILECAQLRRSGKSELMALEKALAIRPKGKTTTATDRAAALYFIGMCLTRLDDPRAKGYFKRALREQPFHVKSACRLLWG